MPDSVNVRIEDDEGNKYYVQTTAENVLLEDGTTLEQKLKEMPREIIDSVAIISSSSGEEIEITDSAKAPLMGLRLYATCKQEAYEGKNLFNKDTITQNKYLELNDEGEVELKTLSGYWTSDFIPVKPNTRYTKSEAYWSGNYYYDVNKGYISKDLGSTVISTPEGAAYTRFSASPYASKNTFMFNEGSELLPYEPYMGGIPSPNGDYPQEIQTISNFALEVNDGANAKQELPITIPEQGFYGIPVESGGNYTDASGQQWISDEIDFTARKLIKRIQKEVFDGSEDENWICDPMVIPDFAVITLSSVSSSNMDNTVLCNRAICPNSAYVLETDFWFRVDQNTCTDINKWKEWLSAHPIEILYPLATPVEYDLSDEEVQAYRSLQTYNDKTVITTNSNLPIWIKSNFILAIRPYVDNKFFELESKMNTVGVVHIINKNELSDNQAYRIAKFDLSKFVETDFGGNYSPDIYVQLLSWRFGYQCLVIRPLWANSSKRILLVVGTSHIETNNNAMINDNIKDVFNFSKIDDNTIGIYYSPSTLSIAKEDAVKIISYTVHGLQTYEPEDNIVVDWTCVKESIASLHLYGFSNYELDFNRIFTPNDDSWIGANGVVPHPTTSEADNKYLLGADGNWHPRKIMNDSFIDLEPDDAIKGLNIEDGTKAVSFVTFDFNNIVTKLTELSKNSTKIHFEMELETTGNISNDYHINGSFMVNKSGLIPTTVFTSPLTKNSNPIGYLENPSALYNEVIDTPGFYIMDSSLKTVTFALYTVLANSTVRIKDFYIHVDESVISLEDLTIEWKLLTIDKPEWVAFKVQKFTNGSLIPPTRIFEQMDIETPIDEADSFTLEKERIKNNGLVPAPYQYEADQGKVLRADGSWGYQHPPIIECSSIENSENLILTSEGEEILEELLSTPCFNFVIKLHGLSTDTFTATSQFAIAKNDRYIKLYDAATSEAIVVLKGDSYVYVTIIKVSENIYHGMCIRHNYNVEN